MSDDNGNEQSAQTESRSLLGRISNAVEGAARWVAVRVGEALGSAAEGVAGEQPRMQASPHSIAHPAVGIQRQAPVERDVDGGLGSLIAPAIRADQGRMEQGNDAGRSAGISADDVRRLVAESGVSQKSLGGIVAEQGVSVDNDLKVPSPKHGDAAAPSRSR